MYGENGTIQIGAEVRVVFMHNHAVNYGGAVILSIGMIVIGSESNVTCVYNRAFHGGALFLDTGTFSIDTNTSLKFNHNSATGTSGAISLKKAEMVINTNANLNFSNNSALYGRDICMDNSTVHVVTDGIHFYNNRGLQGGAIHIGYSTLYINSNKSVNFIMNIGQIQGGAIYIAACIPSSSCIILDKFAEILLYNNSSF